MLPLCIGLWFYALVLSVLNAIALTILIRAEGGALKGAAPLG